MKCSRCGKGTDYYYMAGPIVLCEHCACNSVASMADEGLFPFFDNVVSVQSGDGAASEPAVQEPVPAEGNEGFFDYETKYAAQKSVLSSAYGMMVEADSEEDGVPEENFPEEYAPTEDCAAPQFGDTSIPLEGREQYFDTDKANPENEDMV